MSKQQILVCDRCLTRSCWDGELMCWAAKDAGTVLKTKAELDTLGNEHPSHYAKYFEAAA